MRNSYNIAHNKNIDVTLTMFAFAVFCLLQLQYFISSTESLMCFSASVVCTASKCDVELPQSQCA